MRVRGEGHAVIGTASPDHAASPDNAQGLVAMVLILLFWTQPLGRLTGAYQLPPRDDANDKQLAALVAP